MACFNYFVFKDYLGLSATMHFWGFKTWLMTASLHWLAIGDILKSTLWSRPTRMWNLTHVVYRQKYVLSSGNCRFVLNIEWCSTKLTGGNSQSNDNIRGSASEISVKIWGECFHAENESIMELTISETLNAWNVSQIQHFLFPCRGASLHCKFSLSLNLRAITKSKWKIWGEYFPRGKWIRNEIDNPMSGFSDSTYLFTLSLKPHAFSN